MNTMAHRSADESYKTTCCYCGVGCGIVVRKTKDGKLSVEGDKDHPVNRGMLCSKGRNLHYTAMDTSDRLTRVQMRPSRNHPLENTTWDEALDRAAATFRTLIRKFGPESVGFYVSGQCLTEEYAIINKLMKGFVGSNNIDTNSRLCMSSAVVGYKLTLGEDSVPVNYDDLEIADCLFVAGANPAWCHPILWRRVEAHKAAHPEVKIIVADPRRTQSCDIADLHLPLLPGTDITLFYALARVLVENGHTDSEFIQNHVEGWDEYRWQIFNRTVEEAAEICGLEAEKIRLAAKWIGEAQGFLTLWAMGLNQSVVGVNKNVSLIALNLITGKIGKPGSGPFSLTGQPNAMGGREVGGLANLLPAHRNLANPLHRKAVQTLWGSGEISEKPGLTATEMFDALADGRMKAIWIVCTNPLVSLPQSRKVEAALKNAAFVIVQDVSQKCATLPYADLVLPAATWAEKEGTMTNSERRITYLSPVVSPPGDALPDWEIVAKFAQKMGYEGFDYKTAEEIYHEHAALTAGTNVDVSDLDYQTLKKTGSVQWPYVQGKSTARLFEDRRFFTPSGKAKLLAVPDENKSAPVNASFPFVLTTGRIRDQWHTMTRTGKVNKLGQHVPHALLEMNPSDAQASALVDGQIVEVVNEEHSVRVPLKITQDIRPGVVFLPMHWGRGKRDDAQRVNNVTSNLIDPQSKEPDLKFTRVSVRAYQKPKQKIVVVGSGAAAWGFVTAYRQVNSEDEILVFGKEKESFYNRVQLPEYISGEKAWSQLLKDPDERFAKSVRFFPGTEITSIDKQQKTLVDNRSNVHRYDVLILATGSRAALPAEVPRSLKGIFTLRTKDDADAILDHLQAGKRIVIVGGGLLGIEMAGSLTALGHRVTLLLRSSKLMDRQLDRLASTLLFEELTSRGIEVYFNDEIRTFYGSESLESIQLKSGRGVECQALVYAVGTQPNVELAQAMGLECNRGVVVDDYLETSEPNVYALGEIAEHNRTLYGITRAAEAQAGALATFLSGDSSKPYSGSLSMNILKLPGLELCSMGLVETPDDPSYEEVLFIDRKVGYYKKCLIRNDRLVGAILMGDKIEFGEFRELIEKKIELSEKRLALLRSGKPAEAPIGRIVCSCSNVGIGNLENAINGGTSDYSLLLQKTGAGSGCGSCRSEVARILEQRLANSLRSLSEVSV